MTKVFDHYNTVDLTNDLRRFLTPERRPWPRQLPALKPSCFKCRKSQVHSQPNVSPTGQLSPLRNFISNMQHKRWCPLVPPEYPQPNNLHSSLWHCRCNLTENSRASISFSARGADFETTRCPCAAVDHQKSKRRLDILHRIEDIRMVELKLVISAV